MYAHSFLLFRPMRAQCFPFHLQLSLTVTSGHYIVSESAIAFNCWCETLRFPILPAAEVSLHPGSPTNTRIQRDVMWARSHCLTNQFFSDIGIQIFLRGGGVGECGEGYRGVSGDGRTHNTLYRSCVVELCT